MFQVGFNHNESKAIFIYYYLIKYKINNYFQILTINYFFRLLLY